jgi:ABC-type uncharacterized transport system substrate-binding protein
MTNPADPVGAGLVASLARPGGNVTGLSSLSPELTTKRLEILKGRSSEAGPSWSSAADAGANWRGKPS